MTLTREEAIQAVKDGNPVKHKLFLEGEFIYMKDGQLYDEAVFPLLFDRFFELRNGEEWQTDWSILD